MALRLSSCRGSCLKGRGGPELDKFDRIYSLDRILRTRRTPISRQELMTRLECSEPTVYRTIRLMRDYLNAPIEWNDEIGGYYYRRVGGADSYELPGLWLNADELQALLVFQRLLEELSPGLLKDQLAPLSRRIGELLKHRRIGLREIGMRVRVLRMASRSHGRCFNVLAGATLQSRKLHIRYHARNTDKISNRLISPQRLIHYRDNWLLDAYCHLRKSLRTFATDRVLEAKKVEEPADSVPESELDEYFASSYGVFSGSPTNVAILRFSSARARWVADELWHPEQVGEFLADGCYELRIPYRDDRELIMDVLRHGDGVEVIGPPTLRKAVDDTLRRAISRYESDAGARRPHRTDVRAKPGTATITK